MVLKRRASILAIGTDASLIYLLGRFAERSGYQLEVSTGNASSREVAALDPAVIIFLSLERFARDPALLTALANLDTPILVCSSVTEASQAIELGADDCLLHPLTYDDFQMVLANARVLKRI